MQLPATCPDGAAGVWIMVLGGVLGPSVEFRRGLPVSWALLAVGLLWWTPSIPLYCVCSVRPGLFWGLPSFLFLCLFTQQVFIEHLLCARQF